MQSSLPCISVPGSIYHLVSPRTLALVTCLPCLLSLLSLSTSIYTIFSGFVCSPFYALPFSLITFRMHATRFARPSPVTRFLYFRIAMHKVSRASEATWDYEIPKFPRLTPVALVRKDASYLVGFTGDKALNFRITISCFLHPIFFATFPHVRVFDSCSILPDFFKILFD